MTCLLFLFACDVNIPTLYGSIDINSNPPGATVYLDGVDNGQITPTVLPDVSAGTHRVKLELYHYKSKEDADVLVAAEEIKYLNWHLTPATIQILHLQPGAVEGKDAYVDEGAPNMNSGNAIVLGVGYIPPSNPRYQTYLYFDVSSSLPIDAVVTSAYLKLHQSNFLGAGSLQIGLYPVTGDWEEDIINWNNQPTSLSETEYTTYVSSGTGIWRTWHIKHLVKGWLDGSITNKGMLLKPVHEPATNMVWFHSSDGFNTKLPQLVIDYYVP